MSVKQCPSCQLINPDGTPRCDCGYDFVSGTFGKKAPRQILGIQVASIILAVGLVWGLVLFVAGLLSSFTIGGPHFTSGMAALVFGYLTALPIAIVAYQRPKAAAMLLLISFIVFEIALASSLGLRVAVLGGLLMAVPAAALVCGYIYVASVQSKLPKG